MTSPTEAAAETADADGFTSLRIKNVVRETDDAISIVFDVPPHLAEPLLFDVVLAGEAPGSAGHDQT
jgi:hypothetical protein